MRAADDMKGILEDSARDGYVVIEKFFDSRLMDELDELIRSEGLMNYAAEGLAADVTTALTSVHPYVSWSPREGVAVWAMLGGGATVAGGTMPSRPGMNVQRRGFRSPPAAAVPAPAVCPASVRWHCGAVMNSVHQPGSATLAELAG